MRLRNRIPLSARVAALLVASALAATRLAPRAPAADPSAPESGAAPAAENPDAPPEGMTLPEFDDEGRLIRPEGTDKWVFVGSGLGMNYDESDPNLKLFTNVLVQPEAYDRYLETGRFPEKTMLVLHAHLPGSDESINKRGQFLAKQVGFEIALKDSARFEERWAYFGFSGFGGKFKDKAKANPREQCHACHAAHAWDDNVFVQFYPNLRAAFEKRRGKADEAGSDEAAAGATAY